MNDESSRQRPATSRAGGRFTLDDADLAKKVFSPTCTFCEYWKPTDGQHCDAYPRGNNPKDKTKPIPQTIWDGDAPYHMTARGDEAKDAQGNYIVFELHPAVVKVPAKIARALKARAAQESK